VSEEDQIRYTLARYPQAHDQLDADGVAVLFTDNARFSTASSRSSVEGKDNIRTFHAGCYAKRASDTHTKHIFGNPAIEVDGNTANAKTDYVVFQCHGDGQWEVKGIGQAVDRLVRQNGQWLFAERRNVDPRATAPNP
jgi:uncharacterized protein (TIGR02246 family)